MLPIYIWEHGAGGTQRGWINITKILHFYPYWPKKSFHLLKILFSLLSVTAYQHSFILILIVWGSILCPKYHVSHWTWKRILLHSIIILLPSQGFQLVCWHSNLSPWALIAWKNKYLRDTINSLSPKVLHEAGLRHLKIYFDETTKTKGISPHRPLPKVRF